MRARILIVTAISLVLTPLACSENETDEGVDQASMASETMAANSLAEANMALQRQAFEAVSSGNIDALEAMIGPGYQYHGASGPALDRAGAKAMIAGSLKAFPDLRFSFELQFANNEYAAARVTITGTNTGELGGMAPTGKSVTISGTNLVRIVDGKIVEEWENADEVAMMRQLGQIPPK